MTTVTDLQPIPLIVTRYICPFCRRGRSKPGAAKAHMERCWKNPAMRGCKTCINFKNGDCTAGFNIDPGLVTQCVKWRSNG